MPISARFIIILFLVLPGCVHRIQVNPLPVGPPNQTIKRSLQIAVGPLTLEGADHRPGIALLEWPLEDLSQAVIRFIQKRGTFNAVSVDPADLTLRIVTKLSLVSRGQYQYRIRLHAEMSETTQLAKTYLVEREATGSSVRWITASDRYPIEAALQSALEALLSQIEADRSLYDSGTSRPTKEPSN